MAEIKDLENKMKAVMSQAKECVDLSKEIIVTDPDSNKVIYRHWENFLTHFFEYVKKAEKESGQDILKGISLAKLLKFF